MSLRLASIGLFAAAAVVALAGVLTVAWPEVDSLMFWAVGFMLGLFGLVSASAHAYLSKPEGRWWGPLAIGAALFVASCALAPFASALSSGAFVMAKRSDLDRIASILLSSERSSATASGIRCNGVGSSECSELSATLRELGLNIAWNEHGEVKVMLRGDYDAAICLSSCAGWSFPVGEKWRLVAS